jgi:hypothetical protein
VDSRATIYIESNKDGFTFYDCEGDDGIRTIEPPHPSNKCPLLMTPQIFIPASMLVQRTTGIMDYTWTILKAMAGASIMALSGSDLGALAVAAQTVVNVLQPAPLNLLLAKNEVRDMTSDFLRYGSRSSNLGDQQVVTTLLPIPFSELKAALVSELGDMVDDMISDAKDYPSDNSNPNIYLEPGYVIRRHYHDYINQQIQTDETSAVAKAAPTGPSLVSAP